MIPQTTSYTYIYILKSVSLGQTIQEYQKLGAHLQIKGNKFAKLKILFMKDV